MKKIISLLFMLALAGCSVLSSSPELQFFVLSAPAEAQGGGDLSSGPRVGIMPISLPSYLQRPQMVLREDNSVGIKIEDYKRWGEDLEQGMARVLSVSVSNGLKPLGGTAAPLRTGNPVDLRVRIEVRSFEGKPGGQARLEAAWNIQDDGRVVLEGHFNEQAAAKEGFSGLVQAQSALVDKLGASLAEGIAGLWQR